MEIYRNALGVSTVVRNIYEHLTLKLYFESFDYFRVIDPFKMLFFHVFSV